MLQKRLTSKEGYVWFLPAWVHLNFTYIKTRNTSKCTLEDLAEALDGTFLVKRQPSEESRWKNNTGDFRTNNATKVDDLSLEDWKKSMSQCKNYTGKSLKTDLETGLAYESYDAIWVIATALDQFLVNASENLGFYIRKQRKR